VMNEADADAATPNDIAVPGEGSRPQRALEARGYRTHLRP